MPFHRILGWYKTSGREFSGLLVSIYSLITYWELWLWKDFVVKALLLISLVKALQMVCCCFTVCARSNFSLKAKQNLFLMFCFPHPSQSFPAPSPHSCCWWVSSCASFWQHWFTGAHLQHELWSWHGDMWKLPVTGTAIPQQACDTGNELMLSGVQDGAAAQVLRLLRRMEGLQQLLKL